MLRVWAELGRKSSVRARATWLVPCFDSTGAMPEKTETGTESVKDTRVKAQTGDGHADRPVTRHEFDRLAAVVEDLDRRVRLNRKDLDVQFQRLADLQAVIDRIQIAAHRARAGRDGQEA